MLSLLVVGWTKRRIKSFELSFLNRFQKGTGMELFKKYAKLVVEVGANVQKGQLVYIALDSYHREFARELVKAAYGCGAKYVHCDLGDPWFSRERLLQSEQTDLSYVPKFITHKYEEAVDEHAALISIVGPEDPDVLLGLDPQKVNSARKARYEARKKFYEKGIGCSEVQWTVAAAASQGWGRKIFPDLTPEEAESRLWEHLFSIARCDVADPVAAWKAIDTTLHNRANMLNSKKIKELHFQGEGTDLRVGLSPRALFKGGSDDSSQGVPFQANIPTEEVFTTPDCRLTDGYVTATRPFMVNGVMIKDLRMTFQEGVLTEFEASEGTETLAAYISSDEGAKRLGEVALVGIDSPIFQSGVVFQEILLDENAACHIALGSAYTFCIEDGITSSKDELNALGVNESSVHTDIMISNENTRVTITDDTGESMIIIDGGKWQGDLA